MARVELVTWHDVITHLVDWLGGNTSGEARRDAKRASLQALRELANCHNWTYYYTLGRLNTVEPYATGTIEYDHTGGAYERMVTITSGTWPTWAASGVLSIDDTLYEVYSRKSNTQLTLSTNSNPGADVAAGTSFTLFQDNFALPANFQSMGELIIASNARTLQPETPNSWLSRKRIWRGTGTPYSYCILGDPNYQNTIAIAFYPPPDQVYSLDYIYRRRPRPLKIEGEYTGKVSVTSGSNSVSGSGTAFTSGMVGSVIRLGTVGDIPTSREGNAPFTQERIVIAVASATTLTVDATWDDDATSVKYMISDPVDIDIGVMYSLLLRWAELTTGHARNKGDREMLMNFKREAEIRAREADSRNFKQESAGSSSVYPTRLADFPFSWNS